MSSFEFNKIEAIKLLQAEKYVKAIQYFTEALQIKPTNVECLIKRCVCYLHDGHIEKAILDAHLALKLEPKNQQAIYQKAEVYYIKGEFEKALLLYHTGKNLRPDDDKFRLGIQRSEAAIANCLTESHSLRVDTEPEPGNFLRNISGEITTVSAQNDMKSVESIKALLGELSFDRFYLQDLIKEEEIRIHKFQDILPNTLIERKSRLTKSYMQIFYERTAFKQRFGSVKIKEVALHCTGYLDPRANFWQQQKPFYSRKTKNIKKVRVDSVCKDKINWTAHNVLLELVHIEMLEFQGDYWKAIDKAKNILNILANVRGIEGQNQKIILSDLFSIIGNSYFKISNFKEALKYHELDRANGLANNIKDAVSRSMDYLGIIHFIQHEYQSAIRIWSSKVKSAVSNLELTWLYHEIGRCYFAQEVYDISLRFAKKSLEKANQSMNENWQMNANILVAKSLAHLNRMAEAIEEFTKAAELSRILKLYQIEEDIEKLIQQCSLKPRMNERASMAKPRESFKLGTHFKTASVDNAVTKPAEKTIRFSKTTEQIGATPDTQKEKKDHGDKEVDDSDDVDDIDS